MQLDTPSRANASSSAAEKQYMIKMNTPQNISNNRNMMRRSIGQISNASNRSNLRASSGHKLDSLPKSKSGLGHQ